MEARVTEISKKIEQTILRPDACKNDVVQLVKDAITYKFGGVCVNPTWVPLVKELKDEQQPLKEQTNFFNVVTVCGFPLGAISTEQKAYEARESVSLGADHVDMVLNVGMVKSGNWLSVKDDIMNVRNAVPFKTLKLIFEICLLTDEEICRVCEIARAAGVNFFKTSTGFSKSGATARHISLLKSFALNGIKIKASGGIKTLADMEAMIRAGADVIGTSSGVQIIEEAKKKYR